MPPARPPQIRGDLGTIGIVSANFTPECNFPKQVFAGEAFADGIKMGAIGGATQGLLAPLTNPFAIPLLPITVGGGAALGAVVGG